MLNFRYVSEDVVPGRYVAGGITCDDAHKFDVYLECESGSNWLPDMRHKGYAAILCNGKTLYCKKFSAAIKRDLSLARQILADFVTEYNLQKSC